MKPNSFFTAGRNLCPAYIAKRMEIGAVIGAAPSKMPKKKPEAGDIIGCWAEEQEGRCGGATGSPRERWNHCSLRAEVQKGNPLLKENSKTFQKPGKRNYKEVQ